MEAVEVLVRDLPEAQSALPCRLVLSVYSMVHVAGSSTVISTSSVSLIVLLLVAHISQVLRCSIHLL